MTPTRREVIGGCAAGCGALLFGACGGRSKPAADSGARTDPGSAAPSCDPVEPSAVEDGWVEVRLADFPGLEEPGGWATIEVPDALLYAIVACTGPGCWVSMWSICSHGACPVEWDAAEGNAWCGCHGSRFAEDGSVLIGPATEPLRTFPVGRSGDSLWIHRPL